MNSMRLRKSTMRCRESDLLAIQSDLPVRTSHLLAGISDLLRSKIFLRGRIRDLPGRAHRVRGLDVRMRESL
jgi:hypothetical protein